MIRPPTHLPPIARLRPRARRAWRHRDPRRVVQLIAAIVIALGAVSATLVAWADAATVPPRDSGQTISVRGLWFHAFSVSLTWGSSSLPVRPWEQRNIDDGTRGAGPSALARGRAEADDGSDSEMRKG